MFVLLIFDAGGGEKPVLDDEQLGAMFVLGFCMTLIGLVLELAYIWAGGCLARAEEEQDLLRLSGRSQRGR